ncbi:HNH endonuclease signature motif containing protein [Actinosynnema sp. NPDC020468]|uniref:HNH endonuclease n=1 Tax=Actinosynnema sp. NPDC020468 TaxID=3154488 RepID=UPI0033D8057C
MCARCTARVAARQVQVDHVVPLTAGGRDSAANLQLLCTTCHAKKSVEDEIERYLGG